MKKSSRNTKQENQRPDQKPSVASTAVTPSIVSGWKYYWVVVYVVSVLAVDTLAVWGIRWPFDWTFFLWGSHRIQDWALRWGAPKGLADLVTSWPFGQVDYFKLVFWFVVPFVMCLRGMDWGALGVKRWRRIDLYLLGGLALLGLAAVLVIPYIPSLRAYYPGQRGMHAVPWAQFPVHLCWVLSWLLGWEFMHRYFLLRRVSARWPHWGWCLVPIFETAYHLQKAGLEAAAMLVFSIILTRWTLRRNNVLLPFLAHLIVEIELILFLLFR